MIKETIITVDIGASKVHFAVVEGNNLIEYSEIPQVGLVNIGLDNQKLLEIISGGVKKIISILTKQKETVSAISIGSPGSLDSATGIIQNPPNLKGVINFPIVDELKKLFDVLVFLLNDADAAALWEGWLGAGQGFKDIVYITLSSGVGSGIIKDGKLQNKRELGHEQFVVRDEQRTCSCGESNHAEAFLGTNGLAETSAQIMGTKFSDMKTEDRYKISIEMRKGASNGDEKWLALEDKYSEHLGIFLNEVITNNRPQIIILGGGIIQENTRLLNKTKQHLKKFSETEEVPIVLAKLKNPVNLGVAKYALEQLKRN